MGTREKDFISESAHGPSSVSHTLYKAFGAPSTAYREVAAPVAPAPIGSWQRHRCREPGRPASVGDIVFIEEADANQMLAEMVRVTKPGGSVAVVNVSL